ncbi:AraC family transcriptional regulator [Nonomuraea sp. NPDC050153]|uniref:AraC family transcriptional regulator n=1 Tax=Nonomuraea sp. NPDC050153 TaxID=3364359 RepID=UPI0037ABED21
MHAPSMPMDDKQTPEGVSVPHGRVISTPDLSEARVRTQELLKNVHGMKVLERGNPFQARVEYRRLNGIGLMSSGYGAAVEIFCTPPISIVTVNFVFGGTMLIDEGTTGETTAVADRSHAGVFCFRENVAMRWSPGLRQLMLTVDKPLVDRCLRNLLNEPLHAPLRFETVMDLNQSGQGITAATGTLLRALDQCGKAGPPPVLAKEIEHNILTSLLFGQRHNYTDRIFSAQPLPAPRVVRRVVELIHSSPEAAFTVADLAEFAGVSERSLHSAFRRQLGTSPMSYVRRHRLELAHEELLRVDPSTGAKVTDVALRHGFTHTGRFAAAYRERFGESPSATMRR